MPTLDTIYSEMLNGPIEERPLVEHRPKRGAIRGYCSSRGVVTVNPIPDILDTLVHELLHRRYPRWTETTVRRETTRFMHRLTPEDMRGLYDFYERHKEGKMHRAKSVQ